MKLASQTDHETIVQTAIKAARAAGALAHEAFLEGSLGHGLHTEEKTGHYDIVTVTDRQAEARAAEIIFGGVPDSRVLGEETGWRGEGAVTWYVDPIDGTSNFASGLPFFCVSIGVFDGSGRAICGVVYDPVRDELFLARQGRLSINDKHIWLPSLDLSDRNSELLTNVPHEGVRPTEHELSRFGDLVQTFRGVRRLGSCALQMAYVAVGRAAVGYDEKFRAWDIAAGFQLVEAGGGMILAWDANGRAIADPMAELERVKRFVITSRQFDLANSMIISHASATEV